MSNPSTRNRIRHQCKKIMLAVDGIPWHLQNMEDLAQGRSDHVNTFVPLIAKLNEQYLDLLKQFWTRL